MLPYLIAGAIGFVVGKLLEEDEAPKYADGGSVLLAPNGKPSNLTPEQYKLVRTPAFKKWFGDWENSPETASKVLDENGEPLVVYHGTNNKFNQFDITKIWTNIAKPSYDAPNGFYFAKEKSLGSKYGGNLKEIFIGKGNLLLNNKKAVVTDNPNQIKLADGTNTTFDGSNPDIRFKKGGLVNLNAFNKKMKTELKKSDYEHRETLDEKRKLITYLYAMEYYSKNNIIPLAEPDDETSIYWQSISINGKNYIISIYLYFHDFSNHFKITEANIDFYDEDYNELNNPDIRYDNGGETQPIEFSIGNTYYYKNQYMDEPISVKLIDKEEWSNGEIESLILKKDDGYIFTLKKYELEYLFQKKLIIDGYVFTKKFDDFVSDEIGYYPQQSFGLIKIIDNKKLNGNFTLSFVEEVKDGRSSSFNVSKSLKLKNKTFSYNGISLKINNIKYIDSNQQESESDNEYFNYYYSIDVILNFDGNNPDIRFKRGSRTL